MKKQSSVGNVIALCAGCAGIGFLVAAHQRTEPDLVARYQDVYIEQQSQTILRLTSQLADSDRHVRKLAMAKPILSAPRIGGAVGSPVSALRGAPHWPHSTASLAMLEPNREPRKVATVGDNAKLTGGDYVNFRAGDASTLSGGNHADLTAGDESILTGGDQATLLAGNGSRLKGGNGTTLIAGDGSTLEGGSGATLAAGDGSSLTADEGAILTAGNGATLIARHWDGKRWLSHVYPTGQDGIEASVPYRNEAGKLVRVRHPA